MKRFGIFGALLLAGCSNLKYPGWQHVRIEVYSAPESCQYVMQEACSLPGAECFDWYKKRAIKYDANTVVITHAKQGVTTEKSGFLIGGIGSTGTRTSTSVIALADYYFCPAPSFNQ